MKTKPLFISLVALLLAFTVNAQIVVDCNNRVGLGAGNTSPSAAVDILGGTVIRPSSSGSYASFGISGTYGWTFGSSSQYSTGYIGYYSTLYGLNAQYVYAATLQTSDERLKKNILPLNSAIPIIKKLRPVMYDYNIDYSKVENEKIRTKLQDDDKNRIGFIAQEIQKILPQSVKERESDSILCIRMDDFIPLLVKGMQEQTGQIDSLKMVINDMKASQNMLKSATITGTDNTLNSTAKLYQNSPNPFTENTQINCFIPTNTTDARLLVFDLQGTLVKTYKISERNQASVTIFGAELHPGMYIYSLVLDNKEIDSKRMILTD
jgi:hypothetical protein